MTFSTPGQLSRWSKSTSGTWIGGGAGAKSCSRKEKGSGRGNRRLNSGVSSPPGRAALAVPVRSKERSRDWNASRSGERRREWNNW